MNLQGLFRSLAFQLGLSDFVQQLIKGIIPGVTSSAGALQKIQNLFSLGPLAGAARLLRGLGALCRFSAFLRWGGLIPRLGLRGRDVGLPWRDGGRTLPCHHQHQLVKGLTECDAGMMLATII